MGNAVEQFVINIHTKGIEVLVNGSENSVLDF